MTNTSRNQVQFLSSDNQTRPHVTVVVGDESDKDIQALRRTMISQVESYVRMTKKVPAEVVNTLASMKESGRLVDTIVANGWGITATMV